VFTYPQNLVDFVSPLEAAMMQQAFIAAERRFGEEERERAAFRQSETRFRSFPCE
jgi:hypothetical protein